MGMSLRDWLAGQAMAGTGGSYENNQEMAMETYAMADAMLEARKR